MNNETGIVGAFKIARPILFGASLGLAFLALAMIGYNDFTIGIDGVMASALFWAIAFCAVHGITTILQKTVGDE